MPYKDKAKRAAYMREYRQRKKPYQVKTWIDDKGVLNISGECSICHQFPCKHTKVTIADMEKAIKEMEQEGYIDVKVTDCSYWQTKGKGFREVKE